MDSWILENAVSFRFGIFLFLLVVFGVWEFLAPDHKLYVERKSRWIWNFLLIALNNGLVKILFPVSLLYFASILQEKKWGLFNLFEISFWIRVILEIIILDFIIYIQHVLFHSIPILWRLHQMHHADLELDVTSGIRFHPIEIIISMGIKFASIYFLGVLPISVLLFEVILNGMAMFNHSNIYLPRAIDDILKWIFVTPSMHRIHHSVNPKEHHTNYGFNLSIWDRLFGTFVNECSFPITIGLEQFRESKFLRLDFMLLIPFIKK